MTTRIGVAFDGFSHTNEAIALAKHAVEAGAKSLWVAEHLGYREAITTCTAFALAAPGATLVPTAISPYLWHATPTAMALATLDELAPGQVAVALGVGNPLFLSESGQKLEKPVQAMGEYIEAMRKLWTSEPAHFDGNFVKLAGARLAFRPNAIPIYVAAMGPDMLQLAGRIADGVVLSAGLSTGAIKKSLALCAQGASKSHRGLTDFRKAGYIFFGVSSDGTSAIEAVRIKLAFVMRNKFLAQSIKDSGIPVDQEAVIAAISKRDLKGAAALVPDDAVEAFGIAGTPDHCAKRLSDFIDAGLDEPVLNLVGTPEECASGIDIIRRYGG